MPSVSSHQLMDQLEPETTSDIQYKIASSLEERGSAFRLVYESYLRAGLGQPNPYKLRVTPYHLLSTTEVFIAVLRSETFFTMSLMIDGEMGLPMESVYGEEVQLRRRQGRRIAEVSCLADRRKNLRGFLPVFLALSRLTTQYAWNRGADDLLIAVHPKHARFYRRLLDFQSLGQEKSYPCVGNRPAVALLLDLQRIRDQASGSGEILFQSPIPAEQLRPHPMTGAECEFFGCMVDPCFRLAPLGEEATSTSSRRKSERLLATG